MCPSLELGKYNIPSILKKFAALSDLKHGKQIHAAVIQMGVASDSYIVCSLISLYMKCRSLSDAIRIFAGTSEYSCRNADATIWNCMIDGYFHSGFIDAAFSTFLHMQSLLLRPDGHTLSILLTVCCHYLLLQHGKQIHSYTIRNFFLGDPFLGSALIHLYSKCMRPENAFHMFKGLIYKNTLIWNAMINGFYHNGLWQRCLELFILMIRENNELSFTSFSTVLVACSTGGAATFGRGVHSVVIQMGFDNHLHVCTSLLTMYARCGIIHDANEVFCNAEDKDIALWNSLISAYVSDQGSEEVIDIYSELKLCGRKPDSFTFLNILSACGLLELHNFGRKVHGELIKNPAMSNVGVQTVLLTMYAKCGTTEDAWSVFTFITDRDVLVWGFMVMGCCKNGRICEALDLLRSMEHEDLKPDSEIMTSILGVCAAAQDMHLGGQIHTSVTKRGMVADMFLSCALLDMYFNCGFSDLAESIFSFMTRRNLVTWNSMISGYSRNGQLDLSVNVLAQMLQEGFSPDCVSVTSALAAISSSAALMKGKVIHDIQIRHMPQSNHRVGNALVDMYIKCGCLQYAKQVFNNMPQRDIVAWNSMISGYGSHGRGSEAIKLFEHMQKFGPLPDEITFLSLISCCSHSGLVEKGMQLFQLMSGDYGIVPCMQHYANVVDLLGRAGKLWEAYNFIQSMPMTPDRRVWLCFLSACTAHKHVELGELAAFQLLKMEPDRSDNYFQLLKLYGDAGLWKKAAGLRMVMKQRELKKNPGCSWIEVKDRVLIFLSGDSSSLHNVEAYSTLNVLKSHMKTDRQVAELCECAANVDVPFAREAI